MSVATRKKTVSATVQALADSARAKAIAKKREELEARHAEGQLVMWPESERGIPNELVRCAIFGVKNRNAKRSFYLANSPLVVPVIGGGEVILTGEELRQDDETVWLQLVHMAKESRSTQVFFTPYAFLRAINWPTTGPTYQRLLTTLRRLQTASIEVYSKRFDRGVSAGLIVDFSYNKLADGSPWSVRVFGPENEMFFLFDKLYSRVDWHTRLALPEGVSTWLHGFFSSHRDPYGHKIETLARGAGLELELPEDLELTETARIAKQKERLRTAKKIIKRALEALKNIGFLEKFEISKNGVVNVVRARTT
jgi:hypothetical protein